MILAHFGSIFGFRGVPGMLLGTLGDHLCARTPEKVDLGWLWGPRWSPLRDPAGTLFRPGTLMPSLWKQFVSSFGGSRRGPRLGASNLHENRRFLGW